MRRVIGILELALVLIVALSCTEACTATGGIATSNTTTARSGSTSKVGTASADTRPVTYAFGEYGVIMAGRMTTATFGPIELRTSVPVTVIGISAVESTGGARVSAWGHRPDPQLPDAPSIADSESLLRHGFSDPPAALEAGCDTAQLAVFDPETGMLNPTSL